MSDRKMRWKKGVRCKVANQSSSIWMRRKRKQDTVGKKKTMKEWKRNQLSNNSAKEKINKTQWKMRRKKGVRCKVAKQTNSIRIQRKMQKNLNVIKAKRCPNSDVQDSLNLMMYHYEVLEMQEVNLVTI